MTSGPNVVEKKKKKKKKTKKKKTKKKKKNFLTGTTQTPSASLFPFNFKKDVS